MDMWELVARERIRDTLMRYTWSGDAGRLDGLVSAFHDDGVLGIRGGERLEGREAILAFVSCVGSGGPLGIVRHLLTNTRITSLAPDRADVASYFTVITDIGLDHHGRYRDVFEPAGDEWLIRHRLVSTDWRDPGSTMVAPSMFPGG